jgi:NAD(P)-dependent dehydrogenase (short-subunit alcohol dehydrogenase family)
VFITGYEHLQARVAKGVIAVVLIIGLILTFVRPSWTRPVGLTAQGFALLGTPEDVARAALFLASDQAAWITGVIVDVAGGAVLA